MTDSRAMIRTAEADARWQEWCARGVESDRRSAVRMGTVTILMIIGVLAWLLVSVA